MAEDWQVGDLALCIIGTWPQPCDEHPKLNEINRVSAIYSDVAPCGTDGLCLRFENKEAHRGWWAAAFRKIRPDHSADEIETGIIQKIKGRAPEVTGRLGGLTTEARHRLHVAQACAKLCQQKGEPVPAILADRIAARLPADPVRS